MAMIAEPETIEAVNRFVYDLPADEYHRRVFGVASNSALKQIAKTPAHYLAWVNGSETTPTDAMVFGRLLHLYVLELPVFLQSVAVEPAFGDCRKTENKARRDAWRLEHADCEIISAEDMDLCKAMGDSIHKHPVASRLIEQCQREVTAFWTDRDIGILCKGRLDGFPRSQRIIADVKTTKDASEDGFAASIANLDYDVQAAFYCDGVETITGKAPRFVFVAVEKEPPYLVATYTLDDISIQRGRDIYRERLETLARCIESQDFPGYGTATKMISTPFWRHKV